MLDFSPTARLVYLTEIALEYQVGDQHAGVIHTTVSGVGATPAALEYQDVHFADTSPIGTSLKSVVVSNTGDAAAETVAFQIASVHFDMANNRCGNIIKGHSTCVLDIWFSPLDIGFKVGDLRANYRNGREDASRIQNLDGLGKRSTQFLQMADPVAYGHFGKVIDVDPSGQHLASGGDYSGVTLYRRDNATNTWQFEKLFANEPNQERGMSVKFWDANTLLIANTLPNAFGLEGAGKIEVYQGPNWDLVQVIGPDEGDRYSAFGNPMAVSDTRLVVGMPYRWRDLSDENTYREGAVYVFERDNNGFYQRYKIESPVQSREFAFGGAVNIKGDTLVVGVTNASDTTGHVFIYHFEGGSWVLKQDLRNPEGIHVGDFFGSYFVSGPKGPQFGYDENKLIIGAQGVAATLGAVYVFDKNPTTGLYAFSQKLDGALLGASGRFGMSLSFSGNKLAVAAPTHLGTGAVYLFSQKSNGPFALVGKMEQGTVSNGFFGSSIFLGGGILASYCGYQGGVNPLGAQVTEAGSATVTF
jgi:hypothetical protein